jgi:hypothetical protein
MLPVSGAAQLSASGDLGAPAGDLGQRRVLQVGQAGLRRQEQVPQALRLGEL